MLDWNNCGKIFNPSSVPTHDTFVSIKGTKELSTPLPCLSFSCPVRSLWSWSKLSPCLTVLCLSSTWPHVVIGTKKLRIYSDEVTHSLIYANILSNVQITFCIYQHLSKWRKQPHFPLYTAIWLLWCSFLSVMTGIWHVNGTFNSFEIFMVKWHLAIREAQNKDIKLIELKIINIMIPSISCSSVLFLMA